jgi:hypothetical protein
MPRKGPSTAFRTDPSAPDRDTGQEWPRAGPSTALRTGPSTALRTGPSTALRTGPSTALRTGRGWRKGRWFTFDGFAMARFVAAVRGGALVVEAARAAGVTVATLYRRRKACAGFAAAWDEAAAASAGPELVCAVNGRSWQLAQGGRRLRFGRARKQAFLDRFAATCNLALAARAAGVHPSTVHRHLARDPAFAAGFAEALATGYAALEAEGVRQGLAAQEAYRIARGTADEEALAAQSFERSLQLLREHKRGHGRIGRRPTGRLAKWSFQDAFKALEKRLQAFGLRVERGEEAPEEEED